MGPRLGQWDIELLNASRDVARDDNGIISRFAPSALIDTFTPTNAARNSAIAVSVVPSDASRVSKSLVLLSDVMSALILANTYAVASRLGTCNRP